MKALDKQNKKILNWVKVFKFDKFLGSIDTSSAKIRKDIYDYWKGIANDFPQLKKDAKDFLEAIKLMKICPKI